MSESDHWRVRLMRALRGGVRRGEQSGQLFQGVVLGQAVDSSDVDPEELEETARRELVELLKTPSSERRGLIAREQERFRNPLLADELIEEARQVLLRDPEEALELARLAVTVAHGIDPLAHGAGRQLEILARATAHEANARRTRGELEEGDGLLQFARQCLKRVERCPPLLSAELDGLLASIRASQRRFEEFHELIDGVIARYREHGDQAHTAHFLILKAMYLEYEKRSEEAMDVIEQARSLISREGNAWLCLCAEHQMAWILCDMGYPVAAGERLEANRDLYSRFGQRTRLRRQWVRAKIAHGLGETGKAEGLYREAKDGFRDQGSVYDSAIVSLELAALYLQQERLPELWQLVEEMLPVFRSREIHREVTMVFQLFRESLEKEAASFVIA